MSNTIMEVAAFGLLGWFAFQVFYFQKLASNQD